MPCPTLEHKSGRMAGLWNEDWGNGNEARDLFLLSCPTSLSTDTSTCITLEWNLSNQDTSGDRRKCPD